MSATSPIAGIHHVTAITADAQNNIDFYCGVLGLRLVKLTVNFDDPGSYHLYYGGETGTPGTILTFFAWPGAYRGTIGPPSVTATAFAVPLASQAYWTKRLKDHHIETDEIDVRFGQPVLAFADPDGMRLELIFADSPGQPWTEGGVPAEHSIRGFHGITLSEEGYEKTATLLTDAMGFVADGSDQNRFRYRAKAAGLASVVDLLCVPGAQQSDLGAGIVHHVAFRTPDDVQQALWRKEIVRLGFNVSLVMDRTYFHSIYFREPGGVLFEIATDIPGFTSDQPASELGTRLMLPAWVEPHRVQIEKRLPKVKLPAPIAP